MPTYQLLTDRTLAHSSAITPTTLIHIVYTGDPSQNLAGSSYKAELGQLAGLFSGSTFSGGSGNCIADLYVTNIHGCSPITIYDSIKSPGSTVTNQELAFSYGIRTSATTSASTALNYETRASGIGSLAQGANTWASNTASHAEGAYTIASGVGSHAEGGYNIGSTIYSGGTASGRGSHAEGAFTIASGDGSHAEGVATLASGRGSHAEGGYYDGGVFSGGTAIGRSSHAEGLLTTSEGTGSHAEGRFTLSYGAGSHAEGSGTTSFGQYSHSEGKGTYASGNFQSVVGQFNSTGDTTEGAFMIGNGSDNVNRSNLLFAAGNEVNVSGKTTTTNLEVTSGATVRGNVLLNTLSGNTGIGTISPLTKLDIAAFNTTTAVNNTLRFTDTDTVAGAQFNGKIEFYSSDTDGVGVKSYIGGIINALSEGSLIFATTGTTGSLSGGTIVGERMRIDSNGNVGIGTSNPSSILHVNSGDFVIDDIAFRAVNNEPVPKGVFIIPTADNGSYNFNTISGDTVITATGGRSLVIGAGGVGSGFRFSGTPTPTPTSAIITTGAKLGIGAAFYVSSEQPSTGIDVDSNGRFRAIGSTASAGALHYSSDGTLTTNTSDIRLKEKIEPLTNSLEKILQLSGITYNWIGIEGKRIGFIAQEVEKVIPELVFTNNNTEDEIKGIHQDNLTAVLVEAIKEQQKIIEELKIRISNLES
jgi:hypothetical protein